MLSRTVCANYRMLLVREVAKVDIGKNIKIKGRDILTKTSTAIATTEPKEMQFNSNELDLIRKTVAKDATDDELKMFLYVAGKRGLNPLTRQIYFVKYGSQHVMQTSIDGFRLIADRTGKYAPSPKPTMFEHRENRLFSATVFGMKLVGGQFIEFSATAHFDEYKVDTNALWKTKPHVMLEKCAESKLLRRGFPEELSGLYTDDEMAQATIVDIQKPIIEASVTELPAEASKPSGGSNHLVKAAEEAGAIVTNITPNDFPNLTAEYGVSLAKCWEHGDDWRTNKFGKLFHTMPQGFCNFNDRIKPVTAKIAEKAGLDVYAMTEKIKAQYEGRTWSKLTEIEQCAFLESLIPEVPSQ
jgi:phage recombination protein Bet